MEQFWGTFHILSQWAPREIKLQLPTMETYLIMNVESINCSLSSLTLPIPSLMLSGITFQIIYLLTSLCLETTQIKIGQIEPRHMIYENYWIYSKGNKHIIFLLSCSSYSHSDPHKLMANSRLSFCPRNPKARTHFCRFPLILSFDFFKIIITLATF